MLYRQTVINNKNHRYTWAKKKNLSGRHSFGCQSYLPFYRYQLCVPYFFRPDCILSCAPLSMSMLTHRMIRSSGQVIVLIQNLSKLFVLMAAFRLQFKPIRMPTETEHTKANSLWLTNAHINDIQLTSYDHRCWTNWYSTCTRDLISLFLFFFSLSFPELFVVVVVAYYL